MTDTSSPLSPDTQAVLLLCGHFGPATPAPLTLSEYNEVARWLKTSQCRPADLISSRAPELLAAFPANHPKLAPERLSALLARGVALAFEVERWSQQSIWVISRAEPAYPGALRQRLGNAAPVLLYGVGNRVLLTANGLGIVGARDADAAALAFTRQAAEHCATHGLTVVSGGARGVDQESASAALAVGGSALVVLAEGVAKMAVSKQYRPGLAAGQVALVSSFHPGARWTTGSAMARNKLIYGLSQATLVVTSGLDGGTWEGARENLRGGWVPLLVRADELMPPGNQALLAKGGHPVDSAQLAALPELLRHLAAPEATGSQHTSVAAPAPEPYPAQAALVLEAVKEPMVATSTPSVIGALSASEGSSLPITGEEVPRRNDLLVTPGVDLFAVVWPYLQQEFGAEVLESELRNVGDKFLIQPAQLREWVKQAVGKGLLRKLNKPVRYRAASGRPTNKLPLFAE